MSNWPNPTTYKCHIRAIDCVDRMVPEAILYLRAISKREARNFMEKYFEGYEILSIEEAD